MAQVRAQMGPDAIILSSRSVGDNFEMLAAIDFDEARFEAAAHANTSLEPAPPAVEEKPQASQIMPAAPTPAPVVEQAATKPIATTADTFAATLAQQSMGELPGVDQLAKDLPGHPAYLGADCSLTDLQSGLANMREMLVRELSRLPAPNVGPTHEVQPALLHQLADIGLPEALCEDIVDELKLSARGPDAWSKANQLISSKIGDCENTALDKSGIYAFLGTTGVGKTTAMSKLAAHFVEREGRAGIGMITTDCYRIGGQEQLQVFADYLNIPLVVATSEEELKRALQLFSTKKLVLIDTPGISQKDARLHHQYQMLSNTGYDIKPYLVLPATSHAATLHEVANVFSDAVVAGTIITKVDESSCLGGVIDVLIRNRLKLAYIGTGQRVPDDMSRGNAQELLAWAKSLTKKMGDEAANDSQAKQVAG
jgi:flagellar biosynthesis protein FlhF